MDQQKTELLKKVIKKIDECDDLDKLKIIYEKLQDMDKSSKCAVRVRSKKCKEMAEKKLFCKNGHNVYDNETKCSWCGEPATTNFDEPPYDPSEHNEYLD